MASIVKCLLKIIILTFIFFTSIFGQNNFELDEERSNVLQNIISSDIGVADLNNDGIGDACDGIGLNEENEHKKITKIVDILVLGFFVGKKIQNSN